MDELARRRVAVHESAHCAAGWLLGRPITRVWLHEDGGKAQVATIAADADPALVRERLGQEPIDHALDDICVQLIPDVLIFGDDLEREPAFADDQLPPDDGGNAYRLACRVVPSYEAAALVEVGRCRARAMAARPDFIHLTEALWPHLLECGELNGEQVIAIFEQTKGTNGKQATD